MSKHFEYPSDITSYKNKFVIYGLIDSITGKLRYIGLSTNLYERYKRHIKDFNLCINKKDSTYKIRWLQKLNRLGGKPILKIIEICDNLNSLKRREMYWINYFKKKQCKLVNITIGGDGVTGYTPDIAARKKISEKTKEAMLCPHIREKTRKGGLGKIPWNKGKKMDKDFKKKSKAAAQKRGGPWQHKKMPDEVKKKILEGRKEYILSSRHRIQDNFGNIYNGFKEASDTTGLSSKTISSLIRTNNSSQYGLSFRKL